MTKIKVTKASIKQCIRNGKRMKWKPKRIAETLHQLGFKDEEIAEAMQVGKKKVDYGDWMGKRVKIVEVKEKVVKV